MIKQQKIASGTIITRVWNLIIINQRSSGRMTMKKSKKNLSLRSINWSSKTMRRTLKGAPRRLCSCETQQQLLQANMKSKECPLTYRKTRPNSRLQCLSMRLAALLWIRKCSESWLNSWIWTRKPPRKWLQLEIKGNRACQRSQEASSRRARQRLYSSPRSRLRKVAACCSGYRRDPRHSLHLPWHHFQLRPLLRSPSSSIQLQMKVKSAL